MTNFLCRNIFHVWDYCMQMCHSSGSKWAVKILETLALTIGTFIFACGGVIIGGIAGAMKGQTTETGFCRGAGIGVISGTIVALELLDSLINGCFLSKMALFGSIFNGKAFREWVSPAVLKAYQWQTSTDEGNDNGVSRSDIYNIDEVGGMPPELIKKLPTFNFHHDAYIGALPSALGGPRCAICLQDLVMGERARMLGDCEHLFHQPCIDEWLPRNATCPICRKTVYFNWTH
ncbi:hypothetical protein Cgig2_019765 [Carnegiea gigantea]|uniref:RING-type domain-containing protein n=1 Tax=Carnegiea gigantea TaxID=171969 RepID=A0A9Q1KQ31_9CARY|nr:hypothetical protein Cgig2_019765 [Carnegiea gigantea]